MSAEAATVRVQHNHKTWVAGFGQLTDGDYACDMCGAPATISLDCSPDYMATPMCWEHGRAMVAAALAFGDTIWGTPPGGVIKRG